MSAETNKYGPRHVTRRLLALPVFGAAALFAFVAIALGALALRDLEADHIQTGSSDQQVIATKDVALTSGALAVIAFLIGRRLYRGKRSPRH